MTEIFLVFLKKILGIIFGIMSEKSIYVVGDIIFPNL